MESNATLEFLEDGTQVKIVFKSAEPYIESDIFRSKDEVLTAIAHYSNEKSLTQDEVTLMFSQIVSASNLPNTRQESSDSHVTLIGVVVGGPRTMFGAGMFSSIFARSQNDEENSAEKTYLQVCPNCGRHAHIVAGNSVTDDFWDKKLGLAYVDLLLKEEDITEKESVNLREEIEKSSLAAGKEAETPV